MRSCLKRSKYCTILGGETAWKAKKKDFDENQNNVQTGSKSEFNGVLTYSFLELTPYAHGVRLCPIRWAMYRLHWALKLAVLGL
jgi:hypothetical protein